MGILEGGLILESVAKHPVYANVSQPDYGQPQVRTPTRQPQPEKEQKWSGVRVHEIVSSRANGLINEVAQHGGVGRQKQQGKPQPTTVQMLVAKASCQENSRALNLQQVPRFNHNKECGYRLTRQSSATAAESELCCGVQR